MAKLRPRVSGRWQIAWTSIGPTGFWPVGLGPVDACMRGCECVGGWVHACRHARVFLPLLVAATVERQVARYPFQEHHILSQHPTNHVRTDLAGRCRFLDLGSGVGKTVAMAWLERGCELSRGVELDEKRHALGIEALADVMLLYHGYQHGEEAGGDVAMAGNTGMSLRQGDILREDISDATVVWYLFFCFCLAHDSYVCCVRS